MLLSKLIGSLHEYLFRISSYFFLEKKAGYFEGMIKAFFLHFNRWLENTEGCSKLNTVYMFSRIKITLLIIMTIVVITIIIPYSSYRKVLVTGSPITK